MIEPEATSETSDRLATPVCKRCDDKEEIECPNCHGTGLFECTLGCHEVTCETCYESGSVPCPACTPRHPGPTHPAAAAGPRLGGPVT